MAGSGIGNTQMSFTGIDAITFGVADIGEAQRFLDDWGTTPISAADDRLAYQTRDGGEVFVRKRGDADLPVWTPPSSAFRRRASCRAWMRTARPG